MNKQKLVLMILDYVDYRQSNTKAYYKRNNSTQAEEEWLDLVVGEDDEWQKLIHYIYQDEEDE